MTTAEEPPPPPPPSSTPATATFKSNIERLNDKDNGLQVNVYRPYLNNTQEWWDRIVQNTQWYRVKYKSGRYQKQCETPCWTAFFGGRKEYSPYVPVPSWLQPLVDKVSGDLNLSHPPFNAMLLRLYFDGNDEIAWHTDGRTFLGSQPTIASLSFGATTTFQMRRMHNVWPPLDGSAGDGVDRSTPQIDFTVGDGDMLVMQGDTQKFWHHRVPKEKGRRPRLNINFRYIMAGTDAERGQKTYYKYMVYGDDEDPPTFTYDQILKTRGGMMNFIGTGGRTGSKISATRDSDSDNNRNTSSCNTSEDPATILLQAYLNAEGIDESSFLELPEDIRQELLDDWKSRQPTSLVLKPPQEASKRKRMVGETNSKAKGGSSSKKNKKLLSENRTLDTFFKK
mmetsp:Transcript_13783/g.21011  ORF Transcript_13783/g.21011 Transcript_13783/m.21011 type:complete len:395 (+) Transcript_13783:75-1259(+)|eukprot:CAMPEP_0178936924 /NCGR_PEP_ID=MMETSP0786-20121207/25456_1 /TAXON_ID=186022 /ORGANISM="Thalassionema frauenfeldii, Strain CCMP 1798" /LENGTH=394 /DNA_ID=CAMNT_0020615407 /DNA_START=52 /DNA_END=1236 /DNA_ORIENTATION=-